MSIDQQIAIIESLIHKQACDIMYGGLKHADHFELILKRRKLLITKQTTQDEKS